MSRSESADGDEVLRRAAALAGRAATITAAAALQNEAGTTRRALDAGTRRTREDERSVTELATAVRARLAQLLGVMDDAPELRAALSQAHAEIGGAILAVQCDFGPALGEARQALDRMRIRQTHLQAGALQLERTVATLQNLIAAERDLLSSLTTAAEVTLPMKRRDTEARALGATGERASTLAPEIDALSREILDRSVARLRSSR